MPSDRRKQIARALARGGMEGVHVLSHESAAEILTPKRRDLIASLAENEVASVRHAIYRIQPLGRVYRPPRRFPNK